MSKQVKRKITVNISPKGKILQKSRPSVFERLGTKASTNTTTTAPITTSPSTISQQQQQQQQQQQPQQHSSELCHHWSQNGTCPYGKNCKYSSTHTLTSPSKQRAANKNQIQDKQQRRHLKGNVHKRSSNVVEEDWDQWDPDELADADPDDLEKRRQELQRELELQMKMESKARRKEKKTKKESSPSSDSLSSSSDSSSSSDDSSSSSSSSSTDTRRKKSKKIKIKRDSSTSSEDRSRKHRSKIKRTSTKLITTTTATTKLEKSKKPTHKIPSKPIVAVKSPNSPRCRKQSQTPPPKIKPNVIQKATTVVENKSPRPVSRSSDRKRHTPSPKPIKDREKDKDREKERERERQREKEKEREREREKIKIKEREREKEKDYKKRDIRSPKRELRKESKKRDTPDSSHSRDRKSPSRSKTNINRRDHKSPPMREERCRDFKKDDKERPRLKDIDKPSSLSSSLSRNKDRRDSRERERERERRLAREEREAAREKEREEALARCQERQRERERLKELAKKEEERNRATRRRGDDRGLDKPASDRVERLLPLPEDRIPPNRKGHSSERESRILTGNDRREQRDRRDQRTPDRRKSAEKRDICDKERNYERNYERGGGRRRSFDSDRDHDRDIDRDYASIRGRDSDRRGDDKNYDSPYDRHEDRRYLDTDYNDNSREDCLPLDNRDYSDDRRMRRDVWDDIKVDSRDLEHRRYNREDSRPPASLKNRDWDPDYNEHEWDSRSRRPPPPPPPAQREWNNRSGNNSNNNSNNDNWDNIDHKHSEDDWRHYRQMDNWSNNDERNRRWPPDWREKSRPKSSASYHREDEQMIENRRKEPAAKSDHSDSKTTEIDLKKDAKRPAEEPPENPPEAKKTCIIESVLEDDLSEISDDADDILNRDEDIIDDQSEQNTADTVNSSVKDQQQAPVSTPNRSSPTHLSTITTPAIVPTVTTATTITTVAAATATTTTTTAAAVVATITTTTTSATVKEESIEDDNMDLDFEEISEDELEEESRCKGIGDALGVDWASLVAESRPRIKPMNSVKRRWDSSNVLVNLGISVNMVGEDLVKEIYKQHAILEQKSENNDNDCNSNDDKIDENIEIPHRIGAIQAAIREKRTIRKTLFSNVGQNCRALSARRDLMMRRHLCNMPLKDCYSETPKRYDPELTKIAIQLFERCL